MKQQKAGVPISKKGLQISKLQKIENAENPLFTAFSGAPGAIRTRGVPLRRRALYPSEVQAHGSQN